MSKNYDLTKIPDILRSIAKTKKVNWTDATQKKGGALSSFKNPSVRKLGYAAGILGVKVSEIFLIQENPALFDELIIPQVEPVSTAETVVVIQEDGGTPITGEQGGDPVTGVQEEGGEPVQP